MNLWHHAMREFRKMCQVSFMWTPHVFIVDYETLPRPASLRGAMSRDGHLFSISQRRPKIYANA
jgi:hypothetical protein